MDFLASTNNTPYYHWQLSLLIESFKQKGLSDDLIVCLTSKDKKFLMVEKNAVKSIFAHKRLYGFYDFASYKGYEPLNKFYSLFYLIMQGFLKQPFVMFLEPDLVLKNQVTLPNESTIDFLYSLDSTFTFEEAEKNCPNFWEALNSDKEELKENWLEIGNVIAFNNFPKVFFENLIIVTEKLLLSQKTIWKDTLRLALASNLIKGKKYVRFSKIENIEAPVFSFLESNFISYKKGMPPDFNKSMFNCNGLFSMGNPLEVMSKIYNCPNAKYVSDLANKILDSN